MYLYFAIFQSREEVRIVRDALQSLRRSFAPNQPEQHTVDTIEQSIATLIERLHVAQSHMVHQIFEFRFPSSDPNNQVMRD